MQIRKHIALGILIGSFVGSSKAYVFEYKRLYRPHTNTTIHLMYDVHIPVPNMNTEEFMTLPCSKAVRRLFPTEQKFLEMIHEWDKQGNRCDLIWETSNSKNYYSTPVEPYFIGLSSFFNVDKLRGVRFFPADRYRAGFASLFSVQKKGIKKVFHNITGCSFNDPAPLSSERDNGIRQISGLSTWKNYKEYCSAVIKNLKDYFSVPFYKKVTLDYTKDFHTNDTYHALCDIEILSYILSSQAPTIVVYAGGWHCANISTFLEQNRCVLVCHSRSKIEGSCFKELPVYDLALV